MGHSSLLNPVVIADHGGKFGRARLTMMPGASRGSFPLALNPGRLSMGSNEMIKPALTPEPLSAVAPPSRNAV